MNLLRKFILISGPDKQSFLQGIITNDINLLQTNNIIYSALLNAKGRYELDFFIINYNNDYLIDIDASLLDKLLNKIKFYKLVTKINITVLDNIWVYSSKLPIDGLISVLDPRHKNLLYRIYSNKQISNTNFIDNLIILRYQLAILEGAEIPLGIIPIEYGFDELNAISYNKGCYLGQELTNSAKNILAIRKRCVSFSILDFVNKEYTNLLNCNITDENNNVVGTILAIHKNIGVAIINMKAAVNNKTFYCNNIAITINIPAHINHYIID